MKDIYSKKLQPYKIIPTLFSYRRSSEYFLFTFSSFSIYSPVEYGMTGQNTRDIVLEQRLVVCVFVCGEIYLETSSGGDSFVVGNS